jgi:hypothetical protein
MATSLSWVNPSLTATGRKMVQKPISFIKVQAIVAFNLEKAFPK